MKRLDHNTTLSRIRSLTMTNIGARSLLFSVGCATLLCIWGCSSNPTDSDNTGQSFCFYSDSDESTLEGLWLYVDSVYVVTNCQYNRRLVMAQYEINSYIDINRVWHTDTIIYLTDVMGITVMDTTWSIDCELNEIRTVGEGTITTDHLTGTLTKYYESCHRIKDTVLNELNLDLKCVGQSHVQNVHAPVLTTDMIRDDNRKARGGVVQAAYRNGITVGIGDGVHSDVFVRRVEGFDTEICRVGRARNLFTSGSYFAAQYPGLFLYSYDGLDWEEQCDSLWDGYVNDLIQANGQFWACGGWGDDSTVIWASNDGLNWDRYTTTAIRQPESIVWTGQEFIMEGRDWADSAKGIDAWANARGAIAASGDGLNWTTRKVLPSKFSDIIWDGNRLIGLRDDTIWISTDGAEWQYKSSPHLIEGTTNRVSGLAYHDSLYVWACGSLIFTSEDLVNWMFRYNSHWIKGESLRWENGRFLAAGAYSLDGISWFDIWW